jgi:hypothetical protein
LPQNDLANGQRRVHPHNRRESVAERVQQRVQLDTLDPYRRRVVTTAAAYPPLLGIGVDISGIVLALHFARIRKIFDYGRISCHAIPDVSAPPRNRRVRCQLARHAKRRIDEIVVARRVERRHHQAAKLDGLVRASIHEHLAYRWVEVVDGRTANTIERAIRGGALNSGMPLLNPLRTALGPGGT